jgi:hypothetical protein
MTVFHGSNIGFDRVSLDFAKERRDFGRGFYTTTIQKQAKGWAQDLCLRFKNKDAFLYTFEFNMTDLNCKSFEGISEEWLSFIIKNRMQGGVQHNYDAVQGPVANDRVLPTITLLLNERYEVDEALKRLAFYRLNDRISIHSEKALHHLSFMEKISWKL